MWRLFPNGGVPGQRRAEQPPGLAGAARRLARPRRGCSGSRSTPSGSPAARNSFRACQSRELARAYSPGGGRPGRACYRPELARPASPASSSLRQFALEMRLGRREVAHARAPPRPGSGAPGPGPGGRPAAAHSSMAMPGQLHRSGVVTLEAGQRAGRQHGGGPRSRRELGRCCASSAGQQPVELQHGLGERPAPLPEQAERGGQAQAPRRGTRCHARPDARRIPARPACSGRSASSRSSNSACRARPGSGRAASAMVRKCARCRRRGILFPGLGQPGQRVLPHGLQHPESRRFACCELQQALVGQVGQVLQRPGRIGFRADRGRGRGVERPGEYSKAGEQAAARGGQQRVAPVEAARSVCCRRGRSRGPPVSSASRERSSGSSARGEYSPIRAAASSMASGRPSSAAQISPTAASSSASGAKSERTAWARAMNSRTASLSATSVPVPSRPGRCSGGTRTVCSPYSRSGIRLVASRRNAGATVSIRASNCVSSSKCSRLSTTSSSSRSCSASAR